MLSVNFYINEEIQRRAYQRYIWRVRTGTQPVDEQQIKELNKLDWELAKKEVISEIKEKG